MLWARSRAAPLPSSYTISRDTTTAFLQPLHEAPYHFYNCTRYGLEIWFEDFETESLRVSENFHPGHSLAWLASECEAALRARLSASVADSLLAAPVGRFVSLWRTPDAGRAGDPLWHDLGSLPPDAQEGIAAGFEYIGRRPMIGVAAHLLRGRSPPAL